MKPISKEDLREPYSSLTAVLDIKDILKLEEIWQGRQIKFSSNIRNTETYKELINIFGTEKAENIVLTYMGEDIYFSKPKKTNVREQILNEFNGYNYTELARRYGFSERWIREIVRNKSKPKNTVMDGQISLFG